MPKKPHLSEEAQRRLNYAGAMMAKVLEQGAIPEIIIAAKSLPDQGEYALNYFIVSELPREKVLYIISRIKGLLDGSIKRDN